MYPRISDLFLDLFGVDIPLPIYSFGLMVAVAILAAAALAGRELDRFYREGRLPAVSVKVKADKGGARGRERTEKKSPSELMWPLMLIAGGVGIAGSKVFHILENLGDFARDPAAMVFSSAGLTFYGGLICAGLAIVWYVRKKGLRPALVADAIAPGLMLAYGIGRIGCYLAGDGDWGIASDPAAKPDWLPMWLWYETFPRNILNIDLAGRGVYPTMLYEFALAGLMAAGLWAVRKHPYQAGWLISLYLVLNGVERFLIEQIRVNEVMFTVGDWPWTQAMIIAVGLVLAGVAGLVKTTRRRVSAQVA
jgi:phosphatidylglycerol:prolipoprotein diacylglycerol transferase